MIGSLPCDAPHCDGTAEWVNYCGCRVCEKCDKHHGLYRCYCGWSDSGGDGRSELIEMGETIDPESGHLILESLIFLAAVYLIVLALILKF
jgi:hypothetical protein